MKMKMKMKKNGKITKKRSLRNNKKTKKYMGGEMYKILNMAGTISGYAEINNTNTINNNTNKNNDDTYSNASSSYDFDNDSQKEKYIRLHPSPYTYKINNNNNIQPKKKTIMGKIKKKFFGNN
jgi:hypothetical protein